MAQGEHLPRIAKEDFLVGDMAAHAHRVDAHTRHIGSTRTLEHAMGRIGGLRDCRTTTCLGDRLGGVRRRAGGSIELVRVVHLDDLNGLEVGRSLVSEAHEQHRTQGEVGGDDHAHARMLGQEGAHLVEAPLVESRGADDHMDPARDAVTQCRHHGVGGREVHRDLDSRHLESVQGIVDVEGGGQVQVVGRIDRPHHLAAHASGRADNPDLDHPRSLVGHATDPGGATTLAGPHDGRMRRPLPLLLSAATAVTLLAGLAVASAPAATGAPASTVPLPTIAPIPGDRIFTGALQDLDAAGYDEREYVVTVASPRVYSYVGATTRVRSQAAPRSPQGQYRSRIIVRAPQDKAAFNGRVLVEMMNTTSQVDLDIAWQHAHDYLMREGWAYVGITVQQTGLNALQRFTRQPSRYTKLKLNLMTPRAAKDILGGSRDPSLAWDLTSQVGALLGQGGDRSPLKGYAVESLYLTGQSQMAGYAVTYVNAIHPQHRVYDGFLVAARGTGATNLQYAAAVDGVTPTTSGSVAQRTLRAGGAPVISLQTESDPLRLPARADLPGVRASLWRADADAEGDRFRLWEVAGSSHTDRWGAEQALGILRRDATLPFEPKCDWKAPAGVNDFPMRFAWHAALESLAGWHEDAVAPASAPRLERDAAGDVRRDSRGNALGGIRHPRMQVPVAAFAPTAPGPLFCPLTGTQTPFTSATLAQLYPTTADYVGAVTTAVTQSIEEGFLLPVDGDALITLAARGPAREAQTIREY